jgi:hypothetical protein
VRKGGQAEGVRGGGAKGRASEGWRGVSRERRSWEKEKKRGRGG